MNNATKKTTNIKVCDAIMGSGKTTAAIHMMNSNPKQRFIYITETRDEDKRIVKACPALHFARPGFVGDGERQTKINKTDHISELLSKGRNIATTHKLFTMLDGEVWEKAKEMNYVMIIDEEPVVMEKCDYGQLDFHALESLGAIERHDDGTFDVKDVGLNGRLNDLLLKCKTNRLMTCSKTDTPKQMWTLQPHAFEAFEDIYIMTYLFEHSVLQYYFKIHGITYTNIYIRPTPDGGKEFTDHPTFIPSYVGRLHELIHICEDESLNAIGNAKNAFSASWVKTATRRNTANGRQMKANLRRYFTELTPEIHGSKRMWSTFKDDGMPYLMRNGWKSSFVVFNQRATNDYADRTNLVYFANIFMHPDLKNCLRHHNIEPDEDGYALSIFLQWIWRSAIRNGEEIYIYVPSSRMRRLLKEWIVRCEKEYHAFYGTADVQPREADEAAAFEKSVAATGAAPVLCEKSGDEKGRIHKQSNPAA